MQLIENENLTHKTITLDGRHFIGCRYENCQVFYSGGDYELTDTTLTNCQITLLGPAMRTAGLLGRIHTKSAEGAPQPAQIIQ